MDIINVSIDVTKIDKKRLFVGKKGTYLSVTLIPTPTSEYGDYMVIEDITKVEREAGGKGTILGNAKVFKTNKPVPNATQPPKSTTDEEETDYPF